KLSVADVASVQSGQQLIPLLVSHSNSLFPQVRRTERPDVVAREITMGKVAVLVDNTPFVMLMPNTLMDFYQTIEDYTMNSWYATLERMIRFLGLFLGLLLPPLYISLTSVNPDLLPTKMVLTIAGSRVGLPLPPIFEVLTMWAVIEVLREASLRLPKELSTTLGTVGAIVVGTAIVKAGIVSPLMIVIITLTALGLFTSPSYEMAVPWRVLFWLLIALSYLLGLYGLILGLLGILSHLATLENFGVPYLRPFGPYSWRDMKDSFVRFPEASLTRRPSYLYTLLPKKSSHWNADPMPNPKLGQAQEERLHGQ
ncbi:MAG: spore germination protein, partial [Firmicutes bacterium]|nr:spore germination protein [Bacillota bacterium]